MISSFAACNHPVAGMFIKNFWQMQGSPTYGLECILPKGEIELIFSFGEALPFERAGLVLGKTPRAFINGMSSTPVRLTAPRHQFFFGVVLQAAAAKKLLAAPSGIFLNTVTDLELVDKSAIALWHELAASASFEARVILMEAWAMRQSVKLYEQELALSQFLNNAQEINSVSQMANTFCYSTRQLNRKVQELFGMSSEVLLRYKRYRRALHSVHHNNLTLTSIAHECGYYDQAHFNREFKEFTGLTPGAYRLQKSHLPGHLYE